MQIANEHQAEAWNGYEGQHWADNRHRYDRVLDDSTGTLFEVAEIERGHRVPDVDCGTGKTTRPAAHFDLAISRGGITYFADPVANPPETTSSGPRTPRATEPRCPPSDLRRTTRSGAMPRQPTSPHPPQNAGHRRLDHGFS
ncbi:hypothetical protein ABT337_02970 [Saccharopolyspora hirsuta]|uniref:hypothetical protein n=1 Tax=Saccharopolyspora hirsuta TaxID=1837 RepID=UPI0033307FF7